MRGTNAIVGIGDVECDWELELDVAWRCTGGMVFDEGMCC